MFGEGRYKQGFSKRRKGSIVLQLALDYRDDRIVVEGSVRWADSTVVLRYSRLVQKHGIMQTDRDVFDGGN